MTNKQWQARPDWTQKAIDDGFRFVNNEENEEALVEMVNGLLDLCGQFAQGFDYPSSDVAGYEED